MNSLKDQGNKAFAAKDWDTAITLFSKAIDLDPKNHVLYSNRSAANAGKKEYSVALDDAEKVCPSRLHEVIDIDRDNLASAFNVIHHGQRDIYEKVLHSMVCTVTMMRFKHMKPGLNSRTVPPCERASRRSRTRKMVRVSEI